MEPFVGLALKIQEELEIIDKQGKGITMRFCKLYSPKKITAIVHVAKKFPWWKKNPTAGFMKSVGIVNKAEKQNELQDKS